MVGFFSGLTMFLCAITNCYFFRKLLCDAVDVAHEYSEVIRPRVKWAIIGVLIMAFAHGENLANWMITREK